VSMQMSFLEVTQACRDKADAYWHTHASPTWQGFEADGQLDWIRMLGDVGIGHAGIRCLLRVAWDDVVSWNVLSTPRPAS